MNHWSFAIAAYGLTILGIGAIMAGAVLAMRRITGSLSWRG